MSRTMSNTTAKLSPSPQEAIPIRHLALDLSQGFPRYWNGDDPLRTHVFNALSLMFPLGEQAFIDSVRHYVPELQQRGETALLDQVKGFIGQEATHRHQHKQFNDELRRQGYDDWVERYLARTIPWGQKTFSPITNLAFTVAYEHFTAVLGDGLLRHPEWTRDMAPPMRELWQWHAAEETEHKAVAFDVYRTVGGGELRRFIVFLFVFAEFLILSHIQLAKMLRRDRKLLSPSTWWSAATFWWGRAGIGWHLFGHIFSYLKPGFHPWQQDNRALLHRWREQSAGQYRVVGGPAS